MKLRLPTDEELDRFDGFVKRVTFSTFGLLLYGYIIAIFVEYLWQRFAK